MCPQVPIARENDEVPETPSFPTVVIDANAITFGAWWLDSPAWRVLLYQARTGAVRAVVPEVVIREAVGRFRSALADHVQSANASRKKLGHLAHSSDGPTEEFNEPQVVEEYEQHVRSLFNESQVVVAPLPQVDLSELVDRAIRRRRPFDDSGSGFRDSLIWETVIGELLANPVDGLVLISKDATAFWRSSGSPDLHSDLRKDMATRGVTCNVALAPSVSDYLSQVGHDDPKLVDRVITVLDEKQGELSGSVREKLVNIELRSSMVAGATATILDVTGTTLRIERSATSAEGGQLVLIHLVVESNLELKLSFDIPSGRATRQVVTPFSLKATATYDKEVDQFGEIEVESPSLDAIPGVIESMADEAGARPRRLVGSEPFRPSQELLDQIAAAAKVQIPQEVLDQIAASAKIQIPKSVMDQIAAAAKVQIPEESLRQISRTLNFRVPPGLFDNFASLSKIQMPIDSLGGPSATLEPLTNSDDAAESDDDTGTENGDGDET